MLRRMTRVVSLDAMEKRTLGVEEGVKEADKPKSDENENCALIRRGDVGEGGGSESAEQLACKLRYCKSL